jgi:hypothetical protein
MIMELRPVSLTAKALASTFTGDVYVNPIYRGGRAVADDRADEQHGIGRGHTQVMVGDEP